MKDSKEDIMTLYLEVQSDSHIFNHCDIFSGDIINCVEVKSDINFIFGIETRKKYYAWGMNSFPSRQDCVIKYERK